MGPRLSQIWSQRAQVLISAQLKKRCSFLSDGRIESMVGFTCFGCSWEEHSRQTSWEIEFKSRSGGFSRGREVGLEITRSSHLKV